MEGQFSRQAQDHGRVRVLVTPVSSVSGECYSRTLTQLRALCPVPVKLQSESERERRLDLYFNHYSLLDERMSNGWDEFQYHRRLMAVIGVAECEMLDDLNEIEMEMERLEEKHQDTLLDRRCIVYIHNDELERAVTGGRKGRLFHCVLLSDGRESSLEGFLEDVASYLYLAIDSRRHECSEMKPERIPLLTSPLDKKEMTEEEGKQARRRCQSRLNKHLGDLCLLLGQHEAALKYYSQATDQLKSTNDWLWMAAALEGQCTASINASHPRRRENDECEAQSVNVEIKGKRRLTLKRNSRKSPVQNRTSQLMSNDEIVSTYERALVEYSKFRDAALVEADCRLCCVRHLTVVKRVREAADVLQEMVYVKMVMTEEEKVELFDVIAGLFHDLGYHRKSSFYCRMAAMHSVAFKMTRPDWNRAYLLLMRSLEELGIDVNDTKPIRRGWPLVHDRLLHEITYVSKKLDKDQLALSHSLRHLGSLYEHLGESDLKALAAGIDVLVKMIAKDCIATRDKTTLMPLTSIPTVRSLVPRNLPSQLQPFAVSNVKSDSVFIYSALRQNLKKQQPTVCWVQDSPAEVVLEVSNPLPFDIKVEKLSLLTEGVTFETGPFSVSLPAKSEVSQFPLAGMPLESGELKIKGYVAKVFGVESHVDFPCDHVIKVTPPMPQLHISLIQSQLMAGMDGLVGLRPVSPENSPQVVRRIQNRGKLSSHLGSLTIMDGQQLDVVIKVENRGMEDVERLDINMAIPEKESCGLVTWMISDINKHLPLKSQKSANILITIQGRYPEILSQINQQTTDGLLARGMTAGSLNTALEAVPVTEGKTKSTTSPFARAKRMFKKSTRTKSMPNQSPTLELRDLSDPEQSPKHRSSRRFFRLRESRLKDGSSSSDQSKSSETTPSPETTLSQSLVLDWADLPHPRTCVAEVTFKYGCLQIGEASLLWYRESHCVVEFLVQPVVKVTGFNVQPSRRRQTMARLSLEVQNICTSSIEISCCVGGPGPGTVWLTVAPLRQCSISTHVYRHHSNDSQAAASQLDTWSVWLKENVHIEWTLPGSSIKGSLRLPHIPLTDWHLQSLLPDPLQIRCYYIDGGQEITHGRYIEAYNPVEIFTEFHNTSAACVGPFTFELQAGSTTDSGKCGVVGWIGPMNGRIGQLNPDGKHLHTSCVLFSEGGEYEVQVKCRPSAKFSEGPGRQPSFHANVLQLTVAEPGD